MENRLRIVMTGDEMGRLKFNGKLIMVDLHGLTPAVAERLIRNIMALDREGYDICAIHGFNHGTAIKRMIADSIQNPRLAGKEPVKGNPGRTLLRMQAA